MSVKLHIHYIKDVVLIENFIRVNEQIYKDLNVSTYAFLSYIGLLMHKGISTDELVFFSSHNIAYQIFGDDTFTRKHLNLFAQGIKELNKSGYIDLSTSKHSHYYYAKINNDGSPYYTCININDFRKVAHASKAACKYYCLLLSLLAGKKTILASKWTIDAIQELSGLSENIIYKYNRILSDVQVIYFYDKYIFDNEGKCQSAIFATWENREHVQRYIDQYYSKGIQHYSKEETNQKRAYATKYRWLCQGKQYDQDTILAIKEYVVAHNKKIQEKLNNPNLSDKDRLYWSEKLLDETIFERL